jgi:hypothetical protein
MSANPSAIARWKDELRSGAFRAHLAVTIPLLVATLLVLTRFLAWVEERPGLIVPDPVLALVAPRDLTWLTFGLIYLGLLTAIIVFAREPRRLLVAMQAYCAMVFLRMAAMAVLPLEAPPGMLPLADPLVETFGTGRLLTKDLFFSGHTSTLFLLFLAAPRGVVKWILLGCTCAVAVCVLVQHVHYAVDVLAAPFFAYGAYRAALFLHK